MVKQRGEVMSFLLEEYKGDVDFVFSPTATLKVTHSTDVESEEDYQDCWDYARETHYTRSTGTTYTATTNIKSIELMLDDDVYTVVKLSDEVIAQIKKAIEEAAAIHQALEDEGDNEPDYFEYDEVA